MSSFNNQPSHQSIPENRFSELSELLCSLTADEIKDCLHDQDNTYLVRLSSRSLALEDYEVCAAIAEILNERIGVQTCQ